MQVKNNQVSGVTDSTEPYQFEDVRLQPANLTGNAGSGNKVNAIRLSGTLIENWTMPTTGLPYALYSTNLSIPVGVTLSVEAGTVVKFQSSAALNVAGALVLNGTAADPVVFTSFKDDTAGGDTNGDGGASTPAARDWSGIAVNAASLTAAHLNMKYSSSGISAGYISPVKFSLTDSTLTDGGTGGITVRRYSGYANRLSEILIT